MDDRSGLTGLGGHRVERRRDESGIAGDLAMAEAQRVVARAREVRVATAVGLERPSRGVVAVAVGLDDDALAGQPPSSCTRMSRSGLRVQRRSRL
jgi:hypothetical protein